MNWNSIHKLGADMRNSKWTLQRSSDYIKDVRKRLLTTVDESDVPGPGHRIKPDSIQLKSIQLIIFILQVSNTSTIAIHWSIQNGV